MTIWKYAFLQESRRIRFKSLIKNSNTHVILFIPLNIHWIVTVYCYYLAKLDSNGWPRGHFLQNP